MLMIIHSCWILANKKGIIVSVKCVFFLEVSFYYTDSLLSMFSVYKMDNSFSDASSSIFLTNPMTSFNIIACHINVNVSKNFSDWFFSWLASTLSRMPLIIILFLLPYCSRLLLEHSNPISFCPNLMHLSLKIIFSSWNLLIITSCKLLISSLSSVLTELIELVIFLF